VHTTTRLPRHEPEEGGTLPLLLFQFGQSFELRFETGDSTKTTGEHVLVRRVAINRICSYIDDRCEAS
jgi:hypothetical protein